MIYKLNTSRVSTCNTDANPCEKYYDKIYSQMLDKFNTLQVSTCSTNQSGFTDLVC